MNPKGPIEGNLNLIELTRSNPATLTFPPGCAGTLGLPIEGLGVYFPTRSVLATSLHVVLSGSFWLNGLKKLETLALVVAD